MAWKLMRREARGACTCSSFACSLLRLAATLPTRFQGLIWHMSCQLGSEHDGCWMTDNIESMGPMLEGNVEHLLAAFSQI